MIEYPGNMSYTSRYVRGLQAHTRATIAILLVLTVLVSSGAMFVDGGFVIAGFESDEPEAEAATFVGEHFGDQERAITILTHRDDTGSRDAVSRDALIESLELQAQLRADPTISTTLASERPTFGLANLVGAQAAAQDLEIPPQEVTLQEQLEAIKDRSDAAVATIVTDITEDPSRDVLRLLPGDIDLPATSAAAHLVIVSHDLGEPVDLEDPPTSLVDAQVAIADIADGFDGSVDHFAFGPAIVDERSTQATGESFSFLGPLALVLVLLFLVLAYRDVLDILLALGGIILVLAWMAGIIGWLGIEVTQILIAVPFLLIGLAIDYALHVVMRYREERNSPDSSVSRAAFIGFTGVIVAIGATSVTTSIGFFSNLTSDIASISDFGLLSGLGILSAFLVFGALVPAVKIEAESFLERRGRDRHHRAIGTAGTAARLLSVGTRLAKAMPTLLLVTVLVISLAGAYGAVNVDTSIDQNEFLPDDRPEWMTVIPEPFRPGEYAIKEQALFLQNNFAGVNANSQVDILIRGEITDAAVLKASEEAGDIARASAVTFVFANGESAVETPLDVIERIASDDATVAAELADADTSNDGIPDTDIESVFDAAYEADPAAMSDVVSRTEDGIYEALRIDVTVRGDASSESVIEEMRSVATVADDPAQVTAIATGTMIVLDLVQDAVLETLVTTFALTLVLVGAFLTLLFWRRHGSVTLGGVTMIPVIVALSWILGTMYLLEIPYNSETAIITAIAIGIGVDFAIHITERYLQERARIDDPTEALETAIAGTGGAILASAATTVVGFGILALTLVPSLQRFGIVTGLTIAFAFVASVLVLPSLLVLWDRYSDHEYMTNLDTPD